jgi:hypothetical protein
MLAPAKSGGWNTEDLLLSDELNHLQAELLKAIDGVGGGTYELLEPLVFSGSASITFGNDVTFDGEVDFTGPISFSGNVTHEAGTVVTLAEESGAFEEDGARLVLGATARIRLNARAFIEFADDAYASFLEGSTLNLDGLLHMTGGEMRLSSGELNLQGASASITNGSSVNVGSLGSIVIGAGSLTIAGTQTVGATGLINVVSGGRIRAARARDIVIDDEAFTVSLLLTPIGVGYDSGNPIWTYGNDGGLTRFAWIQRLTTLGAQNFIAFALPLRPGDVITSFNVRVQGTFAGTGRGALPENQPIARLVEMDSDGNVSVIHQKADAQGSPGAYDAAHNIVSDVGLSHPVAGGASGRLLMQVLGESGDDAVADKRAILRITVSGTRKTLTGDSNTEYR